MSLGLVLHWTAEQTAVNDESSHDESEPAKPDPMA